MSEDQELRAKALELAIEYIRALGPNLTDAFNREWKQDEKTARASPLGTPASMPRIAGVFERYLSGAATHAE